MTVIIDGGDPSSTATPYDGVTLDGGPVYKPDDISDQFAIKWNQPGERLYETGIDRCVLYPNAGPGVAWNGLISVNENVSGGDADQLYFDGVKYLDVIANEDFQATLEAFSAPAEFAACDGTKALSPGLFATQQRRKTFGLTYRTLIGNDLEKNDHGYKIHIVYNATASPSAKTSKTISESVSPETRSWTINTVPEQATTYKPTAHFIIDSTLVDPYMLQDLELHLYGREGVEPRLLSQEEVISILANRIEEPISETI